MLFIKVILYMDFKEDIIIPYSITCVMLLIFKTCYLGLVGVSSSGH